MIKKTHLLMLLGLLSSAMSVLADEVGFESTISGTTISAPVVTSIDGVDVAIARGSQKAATGKKDIYWGGTTACTFAGNAERTQVGSDKTAWTSLNDDCWTGASLKIAEGKKFTITDFTVDIAGQDYKWKYRVDIVNGDGTVVYKSEEATNTPKSESKLQVKATKQNISLTGTAYVKVYFCITGSTSNSKYFALPSLSVTGKLESSVQSQYTKPTITQGEYNSSSATYPITLATQNDEDGTINYTIDGGQTVSGVASGTVVNVPCNTTIKATVSGSAYAESAETSFTTSDMPALAMPTLSVQDYSFESHSYTVALSAEEGATIMYSINGLDEAPYSSLLTVHPKEEITAYAKMENMKKSATLSFIAPDAPKDGSHSTPKDASYVDGMVYDGIAFSIPNNPAYIAGKISSNTSTINGAIKMRISRQADTDMVDKYGFHIDVNKGYTITSVKLQMLNNYDTDIALTGVYADDDVSTNLLPEAVSLPHVAANVAAATAEVNDIAATNRVVFTFDKQSGTTNPNQAQILINVTYTVPEYVGINTTVGYGTLYYEKELKLPADTKAYTAKLNGSSLVLTELSSGIIPAKTAVIVDGNGGLFELSHTGATFAGQNDLRGTATDIDASSVSGGTVCTLGYENNTAAFYKYVGETLAANKAYIVVPDNVSAGAKGISIVVDNNVTGITDITTSRIVDAPIYNVAGQRVGKQTKGLVIVNGKLILKAPKY